MKKRLLSIAFMGMMGMMAQAQIIYTNIPDGVPLGIDFNNDGTYEFEIFDGNGQGDYLTYFDKGIDNNVHALGNFDIGDWDVPNCVSAGFIIGNNGNWAGEGDCSIGGWGDFNPSISIGQDEYLAVRFNLTGTAVYYGWIRFTMDANYNVTYKDYAYQSTPGISIAAGDQGSAGVETVITQKTTLYPNPASESFTIHTQGNHNPKDITIYNTLGSEVMRVHTGATESHTIQASELTSGLYLVEISENGSKINTQKLFIR